MAGSGRRVFTPGEVLTASNTMNYLMDQTVMNFSGTAARGSAIGSAVSEGMVSYLADTNLVEVYDGSAWKQISATTGNVLQVVSTTKTDPFTTSSSTFVDITGLSVSITPKSASSKIFVIVSLPLLTSLGTYIATGIIVRNSTTIGAGTPAGSRIAGSFTNNGSAGIAPIGHTFLDSPATTSATTYKIQLRVEPGATATIGYSIPNDANSVNVSRLASTITVMEIAA